MRDWLVGEGTPTPAELESYREGGDPARIWGVSRIVGYWRFTNDPAKGEPDASGHGHPLTYSDAGAAQGHRLPVLVSPGHPAPVPSGRSPAGALGMESFQPPRRNDRSEAISLFRRTEIGSLRVE